MNTLTVARSNFLRSIFIVSAMRIGAKMAAAKANKVTNNPASEIVTPKSTAIISITPVIMYSTVPIRKTTSDKT
ncbi:hypothetical protein D9M73_271800 [compost metagenome]